MRIPNKTLTNKETNKQEEHEQGEKEEEQQEQKLHGALTLMTKEIYYGLQSNETNGFIAFVRNDTIADTSMKIHFMPVALNEKFGDCWQ